MYEWLNTGVIKYFVSEYEDSRRIPVFVNGNISQHINKCNTFNNIKLSDKKLTIKENVCVYAYLSYR